MAMLDVDGVLICLPVITRQPNIIDVSFARSLLIRNICVSYYKTDDQQCQGECRLRDIDVNVYASYIIRWRIYLVHLRFVK